LSKPYKYQFRPAYGSSELLFEFFASGDDEFVKTLLSTLQGINPKIDSTEDLWMNDEVLLNISSEKGTFELSKDVWGFVFIMAKNNQSCLQWIDEVLRKSDRFEKEKVDFEKFKKAKE